MKSTIAGMPAVKAGISFLIAVNFFFGCMALVTLLVRFTPMPEHFSAIYCIAALSLACIFFGFRTSACIGRRGWLLGILSALLMLTAVLPAVMLLSHTSLSTSVLHLKYLPCIVFGCLGGMLGVNHAEKN